MTVKCPLRGLSLFSNRIREPNLDVQFARVEKFGEPGNLRAQLRTNINRWGLSFINRGPPQRHTARVLRKEAHRDPVGFLFIFDFFD